MSQLHSSYSLDPRQRAGLVLLRRKTSRNFPAIANPSGVPIEFFTAALLPNSPRIIRLNRCIYYTDRSEEMNIPKRCVSTGFGRGRFSAIISPYDYSSRDNHTRI
jgi:hypothetical protein